MSRPDAHGTDPPPEAAVFATSLVGVIRGFEGDITEADDAFLSIVGYTRADFEAGRMSWREMTPPELLYLDEAGIRQAQHGGFTVPYQKEFFRKDGTRVPVLLVCAFIPDTPGKWMGYVVDLSPPTPAQPDVGHAPLVGAPLPQDFYSRLVNELVRERTRLLAMLDNTDALVWAVDPEFRLLSANATFRAAHRLTAGRGLDVGESVMAPGYSEGALRQWRAWYERALRGERFTARVTSEGPGGVRHFDSVLSPIVDPQRGVVGVTVVSHDVTARTEAEDALRSSEARFRTLIAASPLGIFLTDPAGGWVYANPRLAAIWRTPAAELHGRGYAARLHPDDAPRVLGALAAAVAAGDEVEVEHRLAVPDLPDRFVRVRLAPVREGPRAAGYVGTVDDDTERRALADRLRQGEKME